MRNQNETESLLCRVRLTRRLVYCDIIVFIRINLYNNIMAVWENIKTFTKNQLREREARRGSPAFRAEMARERAEFRRHLNNLGDSSLDFLFTGIGRYLLWRGAKQTAKVFFSKKYTFDKFLKDRVKDTTKVAGYGAKAVLRLVRASGKAVKIGTRELIGY